MFLDFMRNILIVAGVCAIITSAAPIDWCKLDCKDSFTNEKEKNTMCIYKPQTDKGSCKSIKNSNTNGKREKILHLHNKFRNEMAAGKDGWPPAANMRQMTYDSTLEEVALRWAQQCQQGHDKCRRTPTFRDVGQNYGMQGNSEAYPRDGGGSFRGWADEISQAGPDLVDKFQGGLWGHFTQVVWADSHKVGCAEVQFKQDRFFRTVLVCNYGPAGNFLDQKMYKKGNPCSKCPKDWKCIPGSRYPNLCTVPGRNEGIPEKGEGIVPDGKSLSPEDRTVQKETEGSSKAVGINTFLMVLTLFFR